MAKHLCSLEIKIRTGWVGVYRFICNFAEMTDRKAISLFALQRRLNELISSYCSLKNQWIVAELSDVRRSGGHYYAELIEKDKDGRTIAKLRANLWNGQAHKLYNAYGACMADIIKSGSEAMLCGSVTYHPLFGLSFNIVDVDPEYSRDTTRLQAEILAALQRDGVRDDNKELPMPEVAQRIAVISAPGAAGYGDFINQLLRNPYNLRFRPELFSAVMQGAAVSQTVREALAAIAKRRDEFDCVVIIRGGGATSDLAGFDDYALAFAVATFPLPVIAGIGHERDNTVLDFIAHTRVKTPTAAAEWLIARAAAVWTRIHDLVAQAAQYTRSRLAGDSRQLQYLEEQIPLLSRNAVARSRSRLAEITAALPLTVQNRLLAASRRLEAASRGIDTAVSARLAREAARLDAFAAALPRDISVRISRESSRLEHLAQTVRLLSPDNVLARGYSITRADGRALRDADAVAPGTTIITTLSKGSITSVTKS